MWIPKDEEEIKQIVSSGQLAESANFDAKRQTPKSLDLAIDVAAMATDGGVLVIGIGEDENKRLTQLCRIPLAGAPEQVSQVIRTNIDESPHVEVKPIQCAEDRSRGYLVIVVPQSPRAPHMVITRGHNRFYGRTSAGNQPLNQVQVDLLYDRRRRFQFNQEEMLQGEIDRSPVPPRPELGYLHLVVWPTAPDEKMLERAIQQLDPAGAHAIRALRHLIQVARSDRFLPQPDQTYPKFGENGDWTRQAYGYRFADPAQYRTKVYEDQTDHVLKMQLDDDGTGHFFSARAAIMVGEDKMTKAVLDDSIAIYTTRFLGLMAAFFEAAAYWGSVDAGLAVTGINGAKALEVTDRFVWPYGATEPFQQDDFRRTRRFPMSQLITDPVACAEALCGPLIAATTQGAVDSPFVALRATSGQ